MPPLPSLGALSREHLTAEEIERFPEELEGQPARVVVVTYGALVEAILEDALMANMLVLDTARFEEIFRKQDAPLSSWSAKTKLAHALGIISDEMRKQMDQVRALRNAFSHAIRPIDFDNPTIGAACKKLDPQRMAPPDVTFTDVEDTPRGRFTGVSLLIALHLIEYIKDVKARVRAGKIPKPATFRSRFG